MLATFAGLSPASARFCDSRSSHVLQHWGIVLTACWRALQMIIPTFVMERPVMWRERASKLYSVSPWVESMQDVEIPWILLQTFLNSIITYFMIQFEFDAAKFLFFWLVQFLSCATLGYLGMLVVCITPDLTMAVTIGSSILGAWFMMSGAIHSFRLGALPLSTCSAQ